MTTNYKITDLPPNMGYALGNFIRTAWMLMNKRLVVIGFSVNNMTPMLTLENTTTTVSDIAFALATGKYRIREEDLTGNNVTSFQVDGKTIYRVNVYACTDELTAADFEPYIHFKDDKQVLAKTLYQVELDIHLYITEWDTMVSEDINKSYLRTFGTDETIIALASTNKTDSIVTYDISNNGLPETLSVEFTGDELDCQAFEEIIGQTIPGILQKAFDR